MDNFLYGGCPICGGNDGHLNVGKTHWFICHEHKTRWWIGCDLIPTWKDETEDDWRRNAELLHNYESVAPRFQKRRNPLNAYSQHMSYAE